MGRRCETLRTNGEWVKLGAGVGVLTAAASQGGDGGELGSEEISGLHDVRRQGVCSYACLR